MECKLIVFTALLIVTPSCATTLTEPDSECCPDVNHNPNPNDILVIKVEERTAYRTAREATEIIFATIKEELDVRFANRFGNGDKRCPVVTDAVENKVYEIWAVTINSYFGATSVTHPEASSTISQARTFALAALRAAVAGMIDGVALIDEYYGDDVRTKIDEIEKETVEVSANVMRNVYVPILDGQNSSDPTGVKLQLAKEKSVAGVIESVKGIFRGTRSVLAKVFFGVDFGVSEFSSLDTIENSTITKFLGLVKSVFDAEDVLLYAKSEKPVE